MTEVEQSARREGLKQVAVALKESGLRFALIGGYAAWAHGAPESENDVDFLVDPSDAEKAAEALSSRGLAVRQPPEDWLFKVDLPDVTVDVIHRTNGASVGQVLDAAVTRSVLSVEMPVVAATDVMAEKMLALDEHYCDLTGILSVARGMREQVDWAEVERRADGNPFAETLLFLLRRLQVVA